ncbi:unnamed protein product [Vitrella brassicaformis CCMP3155]|uniref:AB hydrolase-1 domain-containing protein n=2 Tax=Vitrella brassicaformis TaxID=1169539 RepID=A0A0G4EPT9_VITBC|nr:unnamed protein product [Vitrella brassicaformis CCMP3155]|eukprot:CEL99456.1 unnamed protein product [Vitrella brassicaformis CCMP3155]
MAKWWVPSGPGMLRNSAARLMQEAIDTEPAGHELSFNREDVMCTPASAEGASDDESVSINTVTLAAAGDGDGGNAAKANQSCIVVCHGYALGLAAFARGLAAFVTKNPTRSVSAIDWPGMGGSAELPSSFVRRVRELERAAARDSTQGDRVVDAIEDYYTDCLEAWRLKRGGRRMILCGHSLGGYLATAYAHRFPQNVDKLILLSPVGIDGSKGRLQPAAPLTASTADSEPASPTHDAITATGPDSGPSLPGPDEQRPPERPPSLIAQVAQGIMRSAWRFDVTPMAMMRSLGPLGPSLLAGILGHRTAAVYRQKAVRDYIYHVNAGRSGGDFIITRLLHPTFAAKRPLEKCIAELPMKVCFAFGSEDWVDATPARRLQQQHPQRIQVSVVKDCGHQIALENPTGFASYLESVV